MKRLLALVAIALSVNPGMLQAGGSPPVDFDVSLDIPAGAGCDFPVNLTFTGKSSVITLPGDRLVINGPKTEAVATNLDDPSKSVTLNITGAGHLSTGPQGDVKVVATGRNLVQDPTGDFLVLTIGRFNLVHDPNTGVLHVLGNGQIIDICAMID